MTIAKILAPITGSKRDANVLATAIAAARPFNAHVSALFVRRDARESVPYADYGLPLSPEIIQELIDDSEFMAKSASRAARTALATTADKAGIKIIGKMECGDAVTASYHEITGHFRDRVPEAAMLSDLVVFAPVLASDSPDLGETLIATITKCGRPILLSPESPPQKIGRRIAIGWDGGQAAAHALIAAMPFLERAERIELFSVQQSPVRGSRCADAAEYLRLHRLSCAERDIEQGVAGTGEKLLAEAAASGADLLVIGGYGHSRLRETVFGGATVHIISHATMPVLLVH